MAITISAFDRNRMLVLDALTDDYCVGPHVTRIQKKTGLNKATIMASLQFLEKEGFLTGYVPKLNFQKMGYKLDQISFLSVDLAQSDKLQEFIRSIQKSPYVYNAAEISGMDDYNIIIRSLYKDVQHHVERRKVNWELTPEGRDIIFRKTQFYVSDPTYKDISRTAMIINNTKTEMGLD